MNMAKRKLKRYEFETFSPFGHYNEQNLTQKDPSVFNGSIRIRKWRIVAEVIDEPVAVIAERIRQLWRKCSNYHHIGTLNSAASEIGIDSKKMTKKT